ncbi:AAA domain-containing protein [Nocardia thailandica]
MTNMPGVDIVATELVARGARLFDFLAHAQQLRMTRIRDIGTYQRDGEVLWVAALPDDPAVTYQAAEPGAPFLIVEKVQVPPPPEPGRTLRDWLHGPVDDPDTEPDLSPRRTAADGTEEMIADHPHIGEEYRRWLGRWQDWAPVARVKRAVAALYTTLYDVYTRYEGEPESLEVVLGLGLLTWRGGTVGAVRRHVLTVPVAVRFDSGYGALSVALDPVATGFAPELQDFVEAGQMSAPGDLRRAEEESRGGDTGPFDRDDVAALVRMFVNCINPDAEYRDEVDPGPASGNPIAYYAPAIILRKRTNRGMVEALRAIADDIRTTGVLPAGLVPLVDVNHTPNVTMPESTGAIVRAGADHFLPLPLNEVQLRILDHVDKHAHTLVQGPPGTGKTHTAAALITHLLAQGKRVLITAHTDRALHEVRERLPDAIKPLCVTVVGDSRNELEELKMSVNRINQAAADYDPSRSRRTADAAEARIGELCRIRADLHAQLLDLRARDVTEYQVGARRGTPAGLALQWCEAREEFGWTTELFTADAESVCPVSDADLLDWLGLLRDPELADPEAAAPELVAAADLPSAELFAQWQARSREAQSTRHRFARHYDTPLTRTVAALDPQIRRHLRETIVAMDAAARDLAQHRELWIPAAAEAVRSGHQHRWTVTATTLDRLLPEVDKVLSTIGFATVQVPDVDLAPLLALAENLREHIEANGDIKLKSDGTPKAGLLAPRVIKDAQPLFEKVRVDGRTPTRTAQLAIFLESERCNRLVTQLDEAWPMPVLQVGAGTLRERVAGHVAARDLLGRVLEYGARLQSAGAELRAAGVPVPSWSDPEAVGALLEVFAAVEAEIACQEAERPLADLAHRLAGWCGDTRATENLHVLAAAVERRDVAAYRQACERLTELHRLRHAFARRRDLDARIASLPGLHHAVRTDPGDPVWDSRLGRFTDAWQWNAMGGWLTGHSIGGVNELCRKLDGVEDQLRAQAGVLATSRAWDHAVRRLSNKAQSDLRRYTQLVKDLGKGKGAHADRKRAGVQRALADCRPAVPVWIMPLYRVVEQFEIKPDMFDVIVVDEASQAGAAAVFLQYLAPRVVVVGDDKQVSPSAVGVKVDELESLGKQYLVDRDRDTWAKAQRSLFDEAVMRFPKRLTLVEHRRCVPEIIGFSNRIAYETEGISLIPVRRIGSDRLPPVRTVHVPDGVEARAKVNEVEADAIVGRIAECLADPVYDGRTFGVISLLGPEQAKVIRRKLIEAISPEEIEQRHLLCGDAADFQGAERDVVFLSLVAAPGPDRRLPAQTQEATVQRYNVAVSRARDQVWLFHSVTIAHLNNPEDMRFRLLDYFLAAESAADPVDECAEPVGDDELVHPFESLFEQRVFNELARRKYRVTAHHTETACDLDLVVTGRGGQLAVQCDGDRWQGADAYRAELDLQRDLERCGWPIHRIRQAEYVVDPVGSVDELCVVLSENGIHPVGMDPDDAVAAESGAGDPTSDSSPETDVVVFADFGPTRHDADRGSVADMPAATERGSFEAPVVDAAEVLQDFDWERPASAPVAATAAPPLSTVPVGVPRPQAMTEYSAFEETCESPVTAQSRTIADDLRRVVAVEGPVTGARLRAAYISAANSRERDMVRTRVDRALHAALAAGDLLAEDPLGLGDPTLITYRVADQPITRWRMAGPRKIGEVPPRELAEVMAYHAAKLGWSDHEAVFRAVINAFGQIRLTGRTTAALERVVGLARSLNPE